MLIWMHIGEDEYKCDSENKWLSWIIILLIYYVPAWLCTWSRSTHKGQDTPKSILEQMDSAVKRSHIYWALSVTYVTFSILNGWYPTCTYAGPWGHQVWSVVNMPNMFIRFVSGFIYFNLAAQAIYYCYFASYSVAAFTLVGAPMVVILCFVIGNEWGSVWCWFASMLCAVYVMEPWLHGRLSERFMLVPPWKDQLEDAKAAEREVAAQPDIIQRFSDVIVSGRRDNPKLFLPEL